MSCIARPGASCELEPGDDVVVMFGSTSRKFHRGIYLGKATGGKKSQCLVWLGNKMGTRKCSKNHVTYYPSPEAIALRAAVVRESRFDPELRALLGLPRIAALEGEYANGEEGFDYADE